MWIDRPSPNFDERPGGAAPDLVVIHYTGLPTAEESLRHMCDPASKVTAHYMIDEVGTGYRLVDEGMRAWHAGISGWQGVSDTNGRSIGIELQNPGHEFGYRAFPGVQIDRLIGLLGEIRDRYRLPAAAFVGHSDVAPLRKTDPGELFPWPHLAEHGFGHWPFDGPGGEKENVGLDADRLLEVCAGLVAIGYGVGVAEAADEMTSAAITAFQRRWRPGCVDGVLDRETAERILAVAKAAG